VGVLRAIARLHQMSNAPRLDPFGIICGTTAGYINAAALACNADQFEQAMEGMAKVRSQFRADQVFRADSLGVIRSGAQ
jgi:NTE family protein